MLSFPIDGRDDLPSGLPRQLGDAVVCPQVTGRGMAKTARARVAASARLRARSGDGGSGKSVRVSRRRALSLLESFNFAIEGIVHVLRTHRNMRLHFAAAIVILVAAVWVGVTRFELIALMLAIAFVLVAEMINSAVEQAIDVATTPSTPSPSSRRTSPPARS